LPRYPRIPHLAGSQTDDGDLLLSARQTSAALARPLDVYEKLDGLNVGLQFQRPGQVRIMSRFWGALPPDALGADLRPLAAWALRGLPRLWALLGTRYVAYGEWLGACLGVRYRALPDLLIFFDLYDRRRRDFVRREAAWRRYAAAGLETNRLRYRGRIRSPEELPQRCARSSYGAGALEGWILCAGQRTYKFVRPGYRALPESRLGLELNQAAADARYSCEPILV